MNCSYCGEKIRNGSTYRYEKSLKRKACPDCYAKLDRDIAKATK